MDVGELAAGALELGIYELLRQRLVQVVPQPSPAAGADWTATVPAGLAWELLAVTELFTTSAVVANRRIQLLARDANGNRLAAADSAAVQAAGAVFRYSWEKEREGSAAAFAYVQQAPAIGFALTEGMTIASVTSAIDVGDQHSQIVLVVRQWSLNDVTAAAKWLGKHPLPQ